MKAQMSYKTSPTSHYKLGVEDRTSLFLLDPVLTIDISLFSEELLQKNILIAENPGPSSSKDSFQLIAEILSLFPGGSRHHCQQDTGKSPFSHFCHKAAWEDLCWDIQNKIWAFKSGVALQRAQENRTSAFFSWQWKFHLQQLK